MKKVNTSQKPRGSNIGLVIELNQRNTGSGTVFAVVNGKIEQPPKRFGIEVTNSESR